MRPAIVSAYTLAVTTATKTTAERRSYAEHLALVLSADLAPRGELTLVETADKAGVDRLLIVERRELRLFDRATGITYAYHPNLLPVRAASLLRGEPDLFLRALELSTGESVLDCTLGFGADATLASFVVGAEGRVVGLESVPELAAVTREGMQSLTLRAPSEVIDAMRRVEVVATQAHQHLRLCDNQSFDTVYFDPFFGERLRGSECSVGPLALFGDTTPLTTHSVAEARRVARRQVVVKAPKGNALPVAIAQLVSRIVTTHKSRVAFHIFEPNHDGRTSESIRE